MKIFSWVHRHFKQKDAEKDGNDKIALLENEAFASVYVRDGWKDGILAIGTMGHDLYQDFKPKVDATLTKDLGSFFGDEDDDTDQEEEEEEEMERPLMLKASKHGVNDHVDQKQDLSPCDEVAKPSNHQEDVGVTKEYYSTKIKKSGERTTLADLFWADSENNLLTNNKLSNDHKIKVPYYSNKNVDTHPSIKSPLTSKKIDKEDSSQAIKRTKRKDVEEEDPSGKMGFKRRRLQSRCA